MNGLWTTDEMARAMGARRVGALPDAVNGVSIDSRTIVPGQAFFAIKGDAHDGHDFVAAALQAGAALAVVSRTQKGPFDSPLLIVRDVLGALRKLARAARARTHAQVIAVTGSVGKTSTKEALNLALSRDGETHASVASFNNHWGVPLSLARLPVSARYAVFEIGMNHAGEITPLTKIVRPHVAVITTVEPVHLEFFASVEAIADAKAEIFKGVEPGGAAVLNRDIPHFARLAQHAKRAGVERVVSFGESEHADAKLIKCALQPESSTVEADIMGSRVAYKLGAPGRHLVLNSLAVLATASIAGADLALASLSLADLRPAVGRGTRLKLPLHGGEALVIDESYNANPTSMRAALALLAQAPLGRHGRRIAVLGDMLELGPKGSDLHRDLADVITGGGIDLVFCAGPLMQALWQALPPQRRGAYADSSAALEAHVIAAIHAGDAVMVKGSAGSKMAPIVKALVRHSSRVAAPERVQG